MKPQSLADSEERRTPAVEEHAGDHGQRAAGILPAEPSIPIAKGKESGAKKSEAPARPVERLFPFVLKSRNLIVGRDTLRRSKSRLHFILITRDVADNSRAEVLADFAHYPVVQHYESADLEKFFNLKGAKVIGFAKSGLAQSIYAELKQHRINQPVTPVKAPKAPEPRDRT
jgi:hypothetical protein